MARNRIIKPEFWADAKVGRLSFGARLLYIAMWNFADDYGIISASPRRLLGDVFENDESVQIGDVTGWLAEIEAQGMVRKYTADEKEWYEIVKWLSHQRISHKSTRVNPKPPAQLSGDSPATLRQDTGPNVNVNENENGSIEEQQDAPPLVKSEMPLNEQVLLPIFKKIASALSQPDLPPLTERLQALRRAAQNVHVGGYDNIVRAAKNLARSPETDSHKTYDWLLSRWDNDNVRRITSFMHGKREAKEVNYVDAPEEWKKRYDESTPR